MKQNFEEKGIHLNMMKTFHQFFSVLGVCLQCALKNNNMYYIQTYIYIVL